MLYWNNPNIHPAMEYRARLLALRDFALQEHIPLMIDGEYGLKDFTRAVSSHPENRCRTCYGMRLDAAARHGKAQGFDAFSTTLTISPYQNHELIREIGEAAAERHGVPFVFWDFSSQYRAGQDRIREMGLYMQRYCGCIYSEEDRYESKLNKLPSGFNPNFPKE